MQIAIFFPVSLKKKMAEQAVEFPMIWYALTPMWRHNGTDIFIYVYCLRASTDSAVQRQLAIHHAI